MFALRQLWYVVRVLSHTVIIQYWETVIIQYYPIPENRVYPILGPRDYPILGTRVYPMLRPRDYPILGIRVRFFLVRSNSGDAPSSLCWVASYNRWKKTSPHIKLNMILLSDCRLQFISSYATHQTYARSPLARPLLARSLLRSLARSLAAREERRGECAWRSPGYRRCV